MREVAVNGTGMTKFGELWDSILRDLIFEAALGAVAGIGADKFESIYEGNISGGQFVCQENLGPLMADHLGVAGGPATRVESACASGGMALRSAYLEVASGMSDLVLASGGCLLNAWLREELRSTLADEGIRFYTNELLPPTDGGLAAGQILVAVRRRS